MYKFKRVLVGLDLTQIDEVIIKYAAMMCDIIAADKIYFAHISENLHIPDDIDENTPNTLAPVDESITSMIEFSLKKNFKPKTEVASEIVVREGDTLDFILKLADMKEADLIMMGKKVTLQGSGTLPGKISKLSQCSVLFVPENVEAKINSILVPVDFSENSKMAMEQAFFLKEKVPSAELHVQNVYTVPSGYHSTGKSYEEFAKIMKGHAQRSCANFLQEWPERTKDAIQAFTLDDDTNPIDRVYNYAIVNNIDMIVMGSKGRTTMASILLSSVAEKMTNYDQLFPLLIVKEKGENLNFFEALFKL